MTKKTKQKIKTEWDLRHLYKSINDPQLEKDMRAIEKTAAVFEKKYKGKEVYFKDPKKMLEMLKAYEVLPFVNEKLSFYLHNLSNVNKKNAKITAVLVQYTNRLVKVQEKVQFVSLALGTIPENTQKTLLASKTLEQYRYYLVKVFAQAKYHLSEKEEVIMGRVREPALRMWTRGFQKILSEQTVVFKKREIPLSEAIDVMQSQNDAGRKKLYDLIFGVLKEIAPIAEMEMNAVYTYKKIDDSLRGAQTAYERTVVEYENTPEVVKSLVGLVTKRYDIPHRFYKLKAKMHGKAKLYPYDRNISAGKVKKKYTFKDATHIIRTITDSFDPQCTTWFDGYLKNGLIDVFPKEGKSGGAYCSHVHGISPLVLLNHTDDMKSVTTLAHELGHAFHSEYTSREQSVLYSDYSMPIAETASTFFESLLFHSLYEKLSPKEKIIALHDRISDTIATTFRQIAFFNIENELHEKVRSDGYVSHQDMADISLKHLRAYTGPAFTYTADDGYYFPYIPHFRFFFYVYSYTFGEIVSKALHTKYVSGELSGEQVRQVFKAGSSKNAEDILKGAGIDISNPAFFKAGIDTIEKDIDELERLIKEDAKTKRKK